MASLLDVARVRAAGKKRGAVCTIARLKDKHPGLVDEIEELVANSGPTKDVPFSVAAEQLCETLKVEPRFKGDIVSRHQRRGNSGGCSCPS